MTDQSVNKHNYPAEGKWFVPAPEHASIRPFEWRYPMKNHIILTILYLVALENFATIAHAQATTPTTVAVLGIQSIEGDDALAQKLSDALRASAKQHNGWQVLDKSASVQQLSLAHGCTSLDTICLASISRSLGVTKTIYGTLKRTNHSNDYDFLVKLNIFDLQSRQAEYVLSNTLPRSSLESGDLGPIASKYIAELISRPKTGTIIVQVKEPEQAEVRIDNNLVLSEGGKKEVSSTIPVGRHTLVVSAPGYNTFTRTLEVKSEEKTHVSVSLQELEDTETGNSSSSEINWVGWGAIGLGAIFLGMSTYSFLRVYAIDNDADMEMYRGLSGFNGRDICSAAENGFTGNPSDPTVDVDRVASLCDESELLEVLQYVFLGAGIVSIGVGVAVLLLDDDDDNKTDNPDSEYASRPRLEIVPHVGRNYAMFNASLRF